MRHPFALALEGLRRAPAAVSSPASVISEQGGSGHLPAGVGACNHPAHCFCAGCKSKIHRT